MTKSTQDRNLIPAGNRSINIAGRIPVEYRREWESEGWNVFTRSDGFMEIERDDEAQKFNNDEEVLRYVVAKAAAGSRSHLLALWLDGRPAETKYTALAWIPAELLPEKKWTVVGHYVSSGAAWATWIEAETAVHAKEAAVKANSVRSDDIVVIDVFRGYHTGAFCRREDDGGR